MLRVAVVKTMQMEENGAWYTGYLINCNFVDEEWTVLRQYAQFTHLRTQVSIAEKEVFGKEQ